MTSIDLRFPLHLASTCAMPCDRGARCPERIKQNVGTGRWYITIGHAGFNTPTNNRSGYTTEGGAWRASMKRESR